MPIKSTLKKHLVIVTLKVYKSALLQPKKDTNVNFFSTLNFLPTIWLKKIMTLK